MVIFAYSAMRGKCFILRKETAKRVHMKIVVLDGYTLNPGDLSWNALEKFGNLMVYERTAPDKTIERAIHAEIIFTNKTVIDRELISRLPGLKFICVLATGTNVVDLAAAAKHGIVVSNIPAYSTDSVAQLVFAHILNFVNRIGRHVMEVSEGKWSSSPDFSYQSTPQTELAGKILGIIGFGRIGQKVAEIGHAFGMKTIYHNRSRKQIPFDWCIEKEKETVFRESDFLSLHCPLTSENKEFVNLSLLGTMKPTSFIVNTGRGGLINENDLATALNTGMIAGAGLDVLSTEPPSSGNPLLKARNCFISPHMAWATVEARSRLMHIAIENLAAFLEGKPQNIVN
jgi:glycerate dehydrogenase